MFRVEFQHLGVVHGVEHRYRFYVILHLDLFDDVDEVLAQLREGLVLAEGLE